MRRVGRQLRAVGPAIASAGLAVAALGLLCLSCCKHAVATSPSPDSLAVALSLNEGSYAVGEPVRIRMVARNTTARPVVLTFPTAQRHDFVVKRGGRVVWQWSADMMFAQTMGTAVLAPADSLAIEGEWDQKLSDGTNAALGAYTIHGVLKTAPERTTEEERFGIVD